MPGMGMDPMAFNAAMYGGYGGQGMGMNGMNMNMGFDAGQGAFGGFNGQPAAWNAGQAKFNQNSYGGQANMGGGDYGANSGYGGYNMPPHQGNFNQVHHPQYPSNDFHHGHHGQGFQNRGRGRGRGYFNSGRGRGGYHQYNQYNQGQQGNQTNQESFHQDAQPEITRRGSPVYGPTQDQPETHAKADGQQTTKFEDPNDVAAAEAQLNQELSPGDAEDNVNVRKDRPEETIPAASVPQETSVTKSEEPDSAKDEPTIQDKEKSAPIQTLVSDESTKPEVNAPDKAAASVSSMPPPPSPIAPTEPAAFRNAEQSHETSPRGRDYSRGYHRGFDSRGGSFGRGSTYLANGNINNVSPAPAIAKPIIPPAAPRGQGVQGAPTGPKALREGQPNTAVKGFSIVGRASVAAQARPSAPSSVKRFVIAMTMRTPWHVG